MKGWKAGPHGPDQTRFDTRNSSYGIYANFAQISIQKQKLLIHKFSYDNSQSMNKF